MLCKKVLFFYVIFESEFREERRYSMEYIFVFFFLMQKHDSFTSKKESEALSLTYTWAVAITRGSTENKTVRLPYSI